MTIEFMAVLCHADFNARNSLLLLVTESPKTCFEQTRTIDGLGTNFCAPDDVWKIYATPNRRRNEVNTSLPDTQITPREAN